MVANFKSWSKILLNYQLRNEVSPANFNTYKRIYNLFIKLSITAFTLYWLFPPKTYILHCGRHWKINIIFMYKGNSSVVRKHHELPYHLWIIDVHFWSALCAWYPDKSRRKPLPSRLFFLKYSLLFAQVTIKNCDRTFLKSIPRLKMLRPD